MVYWVYTKYSKTNMYTH